ncbi:TPA: hypothetical protein CPT98_07085 [Candidatus Gastranaerophilales bacterium HUM_19]|jgi:hypothetical protein|nr:MAG TPA: hypothetical protein CPT98_07085 [Candidatus Gastranaerophilales bacterium HUM_19]DAB19513.1 MAG TPA: hypothetical protein CPT97_01990 [Candidatus Gastranaerophilales bacterium HUM_17]DAB26103.1 MAG TPA: hypothetical protein CPT86_03710 [Candidatus Gastranaerophilales bacterium HUM_23]
MIEIKFIPTGHIFSLPDEEAIRIVKEDRGNYKVVKGKVPEEKKPKESKSVQELVVIKEGDKGEVPTNNDKTKSQIKNKNKSKEAVKK